MMRLEGNSLIHVFWYFNFKSTESGIESGGMALVLRHCIELLKSESPAPPVLVHGHAFSMNVALFNADLDDFSMDPASS